jgi:hypothetical protein
MGARRDGTEEKPPHQSERSTVCTIFRAGPPSKRVALGGPSVARDEPVDEPS